MCAPLMFDSDPLSCSRGTLDSECVCVYDKQITNLSKRKLERVTTDCYFANELSTQVCSSERQREKQRAISERARECVGTSRKQTAIDLDKKPSGGLTTLLTTLC